MSIVGRMTTEDRLASGTWLHMEKVQCSRGHTVVGTTCGEYDGAVGTQSHSPLHTAYRPSNDKSMEGALETC